MTCIYFYCSFHRAAFCSLGKLVSLHIFLLKIFLFFADSEPHSGLQMTQHEEHPLCLPTRTHARTHDLLYHTTHCGKCLTLLRFNDLKKKKKELCYMITSPTTPCSQNMSEGLACKAQHPACKHVWAPTTGAFSSSRRAAKLWFHMWLDEDGGSRQRKLRCLSNISAQS